ncbi:rsbT co-antagonist protein RsbR [Oikeobacillus pervagus]|uniref:RsbT co-antagonist protein RsbR n=1 Tax=Oikeobacillus pervagus TaxID=1325931 RepID=A0AAJ1T7K0_9BACI|nr:STAS domain-containing protein [Oikeobacillus pervagus]MDQ0216591.1 rsbT co-antagonist protein RsbR [Oikeobacillus pervagus]
MQRNIIRFITDYNKPILYDWMDEMMGEADDRMIDVVSDEVFNRASQEFIELIVSNLIDSEKEFHIKLKGFAEKVVHLNWPITFVTTGLQKFKSIVLKKMWEEKILTEENNIDYTNRLDQWISPMYKEIVSTYAKTWERTVSMQKNALQELSAPLIPVFEQISVMPLIGTIDTERAKLIMENLLNGIVENRSEVVLIDITGVPVVDTMVAHHIIHAADAVRLVGAKCMIVGIRPEIAQTIVNLGINLDQVITTSTLKKGIEQALALTNRRIIEVGDMK